mmetsp:Transcript_14784/g.28609  ORF Transcript_14784/g.28609 Transcript_14784/m.28609 type:complete len:144 (-) Transcript_14784:2153-2584(-)
MVEKGDKALVNKRESNKLTLNALRRSDATIEDIIGTAHQVCLYEFQLDRQTWKRRDVEGSLFVVKRSTQPRFQFIILNRLSPGNVTTHGAWHGMHPNNRPGQQAPTQLFLFYFLRCIHTQPISFASFSRSCVLCAQRTTSRTF